MVLLIILLKRSFELHFAAFSTSWTPAAMLEDSRNSSSSCWERRFNVVFAVFRKFKTNSPPCGSPFLPGREKKHKKIGTKKVQILTWTNIFLSINLPIIFPVHRLINKMSKTMKSACYISVQVCFVWLSTLWLVHCHIKQKSNKCSHLKQLQQINFWSIVLAPSMSIFIIPTFSSVFLFFWQNWASTPQAETSSKVFFIDFDLKYRI